MSTGHILSFSEAEMAEWRALFDFWEQHPTPESLPTSPHTISLEDGRSYTMHGPPPWAELWRVLRRFPRPHHQTQPPPPPQPLPHTANEQTQFVEASSRIQLAAGDGSGVLPPPPLSDADSLTLMNRVGGTNAPPAARKAAQHRKSMQELMIETGRNVSSVTLHQPYFVEISHCEGELMVGIAVPRRRTVNNDGVVYTCEWFERKPYTRLTQTHAHNPNTILTKTLLKPVHSSGSNAHT